MVWLARQAAGGIIEPHDGFEAHQGEDTVSSLLREAATLAYYRRWWGILFTALQRTVVPGSSAPVGGTRVKTPSGLLGVWMLAETGEPYLPCLVCSLHGNGRSSSRSGLIARRQHQGNRSRGLEANRLRRLEREGFLAPYLRRCHYCRPTASRWNTLGTRTRHRWSKFPKSGGG